MKVFLLLLLSCLVSVNGECEGWEEKLANGICIPENYTKGQIPKIPTPVYVGFVIDKWPAIDDFEMTMSLTLKIWTQWNEPRFKINITGYEITLR
jgi:hypothetical protein